MKSNLKFSREMKLVLTGAALTGAVGGWYAWNSSQVAPDAVTAAGPSTTGPSTAGPSTTGTAPAAEPASPDAKPAKPAKSVTVTTPKTSVQVAQVPFLTAQAPGPALAENAKPKVLASASPDDDLPNPFQPFSVDKASPGKAPAGGAPSPSVASGTLPTPSVPNSSVPNTGQAVRIPLVAATPKAITPPLAGSIPLPSANVSGTAPFPSGAVPTPAPQPLVVKPAPAAPIRKPPTPTLRTPAVASLGTLPVLAGAASGMGANTGASTLAEAPQAAADAALSNAPSNTPGVSVVPPLLTEIQGVAGAVAANPLDTYVTDQNLSYNAVVLGPVNTGIFQTKAGYVVVSIGQKLPDSDIVVTDITASGVTLALGNSQKTLELDKR